MLLKHAFTALLATGTALAAPASSIEERRSVDFNWGSQKIRGVNIGGWLVLEPWITPSIFRAHPDSAGIVDEYTLCQKLGAAKCKSILRQHWNTWCTYSDFQKIANAGFNVVRIPIGYWAYLDVGEPYVKGAAVYIDAAIDWARSLGLKIMIDLHGAPKSQNGFDNSGHRVDQPKWGNKNSVPQTLTVLQKIANKYAKPAYQDVVIAIELLNEPLIAKLNYDTVKQFTRDGFGNVRSVSDTPVVFHDGFNAPSSWNGFLTPSDNNAQNVAVDHHEYQVFDNGLIHMTHAEHRQQVCNAADGYSGADKWTFVGEWTAAMTDCAPELNGYLIGNRYEGTYPGSTRAGSCAGKNKISAWTQKMKDDTRKYIETQMDAFEGRTQGWVFWNFKTEGAAEWDAFRLLDAGVFPQPLTQRKFGHFCTNL